jgi:hypothetical protein
MTPMPGSENNPMKKYFEKVRKIMPVILVGMFLFSCHSGKNLSPEEGLKAIKVLNSDLTNLSSGIKENQAFSGLSFLLRESTSPLSSQNGLFGKWLNDTLSSLKNLAGLYTWNPDSLKFFKTGESEFIDIRFSDLNSKENNHRFLLSSFNCRSITCGLNFPIDLQGFMIYNEEEILTIKQHSDFKDELPGHVELLFKGKDFEGSLTADRTRDDNKGALDVAIDFRAAGHKIITGKIHAVIGYNGSQIYFRTYEPDLTVFDVKISGSLNYGKVDPTSKDYVSSFNDNCHIGFYDAGSGKKIGDFGIGPLKNNEQLGWVVYLSDGSPILLEEYLLVVEKIFNYKLSNKTPKN